MTPTAPEPTPDELCVEAMDMLMQISKTQDFLLENAKAYLQIGDYKNAYRLMIDYRHSIVTRQQTEMLLVRELFDMPTVRAVHGDPDI